MYFLLQPPKSLQIFLIEDQGTPLLNLEWESAGKAASGARKRVPACVRETTAIHPIHHVEEDVGVDVDIRTVHSAHSAHTAHVGREGGSTTTEHLGGVDKVVAVVIGRTFPV